MVIFLISLIGLPPTIGFAGKYLLFSACIDAGFGWLAVVAGLNSAVSLFYYIKVAKYLFLSEPSERSIVGQPVFAGFLVALATATILFGIYAGPLVSWAQNSLDIL